MSGNQDDLSAQAGNETQTVSPPGSHRTGICLSGTTASLPGNLPHSHEVHVPLSTSGWNGWRSRFLRRSILAIFLCFSLAAIATVELLLDLSNSRHGLLQSNQDWYYLWTYGPTASMFVLILERVFFSTDRSCSLHTGGVNVDSCRV